MGTTIAQPRLVSHEGSVQGQGGGIKTEVAPKGFRTTSHLSPVAVITEDCQALTWFLSMIRCSPKALDAPGEEPCGLWTRSCPAVRFCGSLATEDAWVRRAGVEDAGGSLLVEAGPLASCNLIL